MGVHEDERRFRFAPGVDGLEALGARSFDDFLDGCGGLLTAERARVAVRSPGYEAVEVPLPGTVDATGVRRELPRGAGTGWLLVQSWHGAAGERLLARLRPPRSTSIAALHWNLTCHLQAHGLGVPALVAMGERRRGALGQESLLVTRMLEGFTPLARWLAPRPAGAGRALGLRSLSLALEALFRSGAWLPRLDAESVLIALSPLERAGDCFPKELAEMARERSELDARGLERVRLPSIAFTRLHGGRILPSIGPRRRARLLAALRADLSARGVELCAEETESLEQLAAQPSS